MNAAGSDCVLSQIQPAISAAGGEQQEEGEDRGPDAEAGAPDHAPLGPEQPFLLFLALFRGLRAVFDRSATFATVLSARNLSCSLVWKSKEALFMRVGGGRHPGRKNI